MSCWFVDVHITIISLLKFVPVHFKNTFPLNTLDNSLLVCNEGVSPMENTSP